MTAQATDLSPLNSQSPLNLQTTYQSDVTIIGAGIAGLVCALENIKKKKKNGTNHNILMLDRDVQAHF